MDNYGSSFEPMDIDRSSSSVTSKMDVSCNSVNDNINIDDDFTCIGECYEIPPIKVEKVFSDPLDTIKSNFEEAAMIPEVQDSLYAEKEMKPKMHGPKSAVKVYHIKKKETEKIPELSIFQKLFFGSLLAAVGFIAYPIIHFKCAERIDLVQLKNSFSTHLFGQTEAANKIVDALNVQDKTKLLFLYGGTGVGKTYAVALMLEGLRESANVYHYTMPTFKETFSTDLMVGLSVCPSTIVVVDDFTINDMDILPHVQNLIDKSEKLGKNITIILVYNCDNITDNFVKKCDHYFHYDLEDNFKNIKARKEFIKFEPLTQAHLKKCIETELGDRVVTPAEMTNILKKFDVSLDGCKGVYTKIKLLNFV